MIPIPYLDFAPPSYLCKRATKPFTLDGNIEKDFWADAPYTDAFLDIEGKHMQAPRFLTKAKMLWDDKNFYFAAKLDGSEIWGHLTERDCVIFHDNDFEIFIDPDSDTQQYYEFEMNVLNTVWDLFLPKAYRDHGGALNGYDMNGLQTAVYVDGEINNPSADNKSWSVEVVIPFKAITEVHNKNVPSPGDFYRVNFSRVQWTIDIENNTFIKRKNPETGAFLPEDNWVWAPTGLINIHYPEMWGFVFFVDETTDLSTIVIPEDEKRKYELRKLYYAQSIQYEKTGTYTTCLDTLVQLLKEHAPSDANKSVADLPYKIETTSKTYVISCPSTEAGKELVIYSDGKVQLV